MVFLLAGEAIIMIGLVDLDIVACGGVCWDYSLIGKIGNG